MLIFPSPKKHNQLLDRGTSGPKQCVWPRHPLIPGLVQLRHEICPLEDHCHHRRAQNVTWSLVPRRGCSKSLLLFWYPRVFLHKQETLLRSKDLLTSHKHLNQVFVVVVVVPVCRDSCFWVPPSPARAQSTWRTFLLGSQVQRKPLALSDNAKGSSCPWNLLGKGTHRVCQS